jgi:hypothetical protein
MLSGPILLLRERGSTSAVVPPLRQKAFGRHPKNFPQRFPQCNFSLNVYGGYFGVLSLTLMSKILTPYGDTDKNSDDQ